MIRRLSAQNCILFVCDVQDKFAPRTYQKDGVIETVGWFCEIARIFSIPTLITEQNPPVFGQTYQQYLKSLGQTPMFKTSKTTFSMVNEQTSDFLKQHSARKQVVLVGMETHICVQQTFFDLKEKGYDVFLPTDCVTSTRQTDRAVALHRMSNEGAILSTFESLVFEMMGDYKHKHFKDVLNILKSSKRETMMPHL